MRKIEKSLKFFVDYDPDMKFLKHENLMECNR